MLFTFLFATLLHPGPLAYASTPDAKFVEELRAKFKSVVPVDESQELLTIVRDIFKDLSEAQQRLLNSKTLVVNDFYIVDDVTQQAYVVPESRSGIDKIHNRVVISTGMLMNLFDLQTVAPNAPAAEIQGAMERGMRRLVGVLCHELAHPRENVEADSLLKIYGRRASSQAREVRANFDGIEIAAEAGYPTGAVYETFSHLKLGDKIQDRANAPGLVHAVVSTHPGHNLALASQRLYLSLRDILRGEAPVNHDLRRLPGRLLHDLRPFERRPSRDVADILRRANEFAGQTERRQLEANILLLEFDLLTEHELPDAPLDQIAAALMNLRSVLRADHLWRRADQVESGLVSIDAVLLRRLGQRKHSDFVKTSVIYGHPPFQDEFKRRILAKVSQEDPVKTSAGETFTLDELSRWFPTEALFALWDTSIRRSLAFQFADLKGSSEVKDESTWLVQLKGGDQPELLSRLAVLGEGFARRGHDSLYPSYLRAGARGLEFVLPLTKSPGITPDKSWTGFLNDPKNKREIEALRPIWAEVWRDRARFAAADLILINLDRSVIDWATLAAALGMAPAASRRALNEALHDHLRVGLTTEEVGALGPIVSDESTPKHYGEMVELREKRFDQKNEALSGHFYSGYRPVKPIEWLLPDLFADLFLAPAKTFDESFDYAVPFHLRAAILRTSPSLSASFYARNLRAEIDLVASVEDYFHREAQIINRIFAREDRPDFVPLELRVIDHSHLGPALKRTLIDKFVEALPATDPRRDRYRVTYDLARDSFSLITASAEEQKPRVNSLRDSFVGIRTGFDQAKSDHYDVVKDNARAALDEINGSATGEALLNVARLIFNPRDPELAADLGKMNDDRFALALFERGRALSLSVEQRIHLFWLTTTPGKSDLTDTYFRREILPGLETNEAAVTASSDLIERALMNRRFESLVLEIKVARLTIETKIRALLAGLPANPPSGRHIVELIDHLEAIAPRNSGHKDELLESLAWRLGIEDPKILGYLESLKALNWRKTHPSIVNFGNALATLAERLTYGDRLELIDYFMTLQPTAPPKLDPRTVRREPLRLAKKGIYADHLRFLKRTAGAVDRKNKNSGFLPQSISDLRPFERIPLFEYLLGTGERNATGDDRFVLKIMRRFLGYVPNSKREKYLMAYLRLRPTYMRPVTLAYLLAAKIDPTPRSENSIYEIFGSMGIAGAQTGAILGYLSGNAADLKDNAIPLSKHRIFALLDERLSPAERGRIKRVVGILGSASINTAVEVQLTDGTHAVALIQRPHAREQIVMNAKLMRELAASIAGFDPEFPLAIVREIVDVTESQLIEELDTVATARKIETAVDAYAKANVELRGALAGWSFYVPRLISGFDSRNGILLIEKVEGDTFDRLADEPARAHVGPLILLSSLRNLFKRGWFNEDQHARNVKIDVAHRRLNMFDFGKSSYHFTSGAFVSDDRYLFANLFRAMGQRDARGVADYGLRLSAGAEGLDHEARARLVGAIGELFGGSDDLQNLLIKLRERFAAEGAAFPRRDQLGTLKGLIILFNEGYVSPESFEQILGGEVQSVLRTKLPRLGIESCQKWFAEIGSK